MGYFSFGSIVEPGSFTIIKVDHNLKYNGIYAYGRYYFRNKFGAQPYLDLGLGYVCLLYTSDAADERSSVDLGGRRTIKKKNREKKTKREHVYKQVTLTRDTRFKN